MLSKKWLLGCIEPVTPFKLETFSK
jgi:hypothetical protein